MALSILTDFTAGLTRNAGSVEGLHSDSTASMAPVAVIVVIDIGWTPTDFGDITFYVTAADSHDNVQRLWETTMSPTSGAGDQLSVISDVIPVPAERTWQLSASWAANDGTPGSVWAQVYSL